MVQVIKPRIDVRSDLKVLARCVSSLLRSVEVDNSRVLDDVFGAAELI